MAAAAQAARWAMRVRRKINEYCGNIEIGKERRRFQSGGAQSFSKRPKVLFEKKHGFARAARRNAVLAKPECASKAAHVRAGCAFLLSCLFRILFRQADGHRFLSGGRILGFVYIFYIVRRQMLRFSKQRICKSFCKCLCGGLRFAQIIAAASNFQK